MSSWALGLNFKCLVAYDVPLVQEFGEIMTRSIEIRIRSCVDELDCACLYLCV